MLTNFIKIVLHRDLDEIQQSFDIKNFFITVIKLSVVHVLSINCFVNCPKSVKFKLKDSIFYVDFLRLILVLLSEMNLYAKF